MLGQQKKHTVPGWSVILMAAVLLLVAVSLFMRTVGAEMSFGLLDWGPQTQESAASITQPPVEMLRMAKPDFSGGDGAVGKKRIGAR